VAEADLLSLLSRNHDFIYLLGLQGDTGHYLVVAEMKEMEKEHQRPVQEHK
jgi:hypothetical protein